MDNSCCFVDYQSRSIRLTDERRQHILKHPEMAAQFPRVQETLAKPDFVICTTADETVHVYHRYYEETPVTRKFLLVVVKHQQGDSFVLTAFFSNRPKNGTVVWRK